MNFWPTLKSEIRKLLTVRSTYILIFSAFALIGLFTYVGTSASDYEEAICQSTGEVLYSIEQFDPRLENASPEDVCGGPVSYNRIVINDLSEDKLLFNFQEAIPVISMFISVVLVLFMAHEFRYNTISHTLTLSNSRSKVLLAKLIVGVLFTITITLFTLGLILAVSHIAINVKGLHLPAQDYDWAYVFLRHLGYVLIYSLLWLGIITLIRNLTAGIAAILLLPTIEAIVAFLLEERGIEPTKVLPFSALNRFSDAATGLTSTDPVTELATRSEPASVLMAGLVALAYLVGVWAVAWWLFLRRDAMN